MSNNFDLADKFDYKSPLEENEETGFVTQGINIPKLFDFIRRNRTLNAKVPFVYTDFRSGSYFDDYFIPMTIPFSSTENGKAKTKLDLSVAINKQKADMDFSDNTYFRISFTQENIRPVFSLLFNYAGRMVQKGKDEDVFAIIISSSSYYDIEAVRAHLNINESTSSRTWTIKEFNQAFSLADSPAKLSVLYKYAPAFVLQQRGDEQLWTDIQVLLQYDEDSWFKDTSAGLVNILSGFNDLKAMYARLENNTAIVIRLYDLINGKKVEDYCALLDILSKLFASQERMPETEIRIPVGPHYFLDSNLFFIDGSTISLVVKKKIKVYGINNRGDDTVKDDEEVVMEFPALHPLDIITLYNPDTNESQQVPAIYVKFLSDQAEWALVMEAVTFSFTVISILVSGGAVLAGARGLVLLLSAADLALSVTDLLLINDEVKGLLNRTEAGRWLVNNWSEIYIISGVVLLSPIIAKGIIRYGPEAVAMLRKMANAGAGKLRDFILRLYASAIIHIRIAGFADNTIKIVPKVAEFMPGAKAIPHSVVMGMEETGVLLISGTTQTGKEIYGALWRGELIISGDFKTVRDRLMDVFRSKGNLLDKLESMARDGWGFIKEEYIALSRKIADPLKQKVVFQSTANIDELYAAAKEANKELRTITEGFAKKTKGHPGFRPEDTNGGLKTRERAMQKINSDYGGIASKLLDIAGSKVVYETIDEVYSALNSFRKQFRILRFKDRILEPLEEGYRDILMNIVMGNGHIIEFRLHLNSIDNVAKFEHNAYDKIRTIKANATIGKRNLTLQELSEIQELVNKSRQLYKEAWEKIIKQ